MKKIWNHKISRIFTLVEVVIALAILGLALTSFFQLAQSAVRRMDKAYSKWYNTHLLSQAAEYYLLFADEDPPDMPPEIFDERDLYIEAYYIDAEGLPEDLNNLSGQAPLRTLVLDLMDTNLQSVVDTLKIDRIYYAGETGE